MTMISMKSMTRAACGALVLAAPVLAQGGGGGGGGGGNQAPPENLQVLAKDMPRAQGVNIMRGFTNSLGVKCG